MLKKEKIEERAFREVYVKILPSRKKNGQGIAGKCDTARGKIRI
jgi:predicted CopG family antitoxin